MEIAALLGVARRILTASTTTCVLSVFGRKMMVNVDKGRPELIVISGEPSNSRPSRNIRVYDELACRSAAYIPAFAPELSACVLLPTSTAYVALSATIESMSLGDNVGGVVGLAVGADGDTVTSPSTFAINKQSPNENASCNRSCRLPSNPGNVRDTTTVA